MYYLNSFFVYSIIGFIIESCLYKIMSVDNYSGFMNGPITPVYGFGVLIILVVYNYLVDKYIKNKFIKGLFLFLICTILLTILEFIGGYILDNVFNIELWDYTNKKYNIGKYICLEVSIVWGVASVIYIFVVKKFIDRFIDRIPKKATIFFLIIFLLDFGWIIIKNVNFYNNIISHILLIFI